MFLLDTNVISELRKSGTSKIDPHVEEWASNVEAADLFLSVVSLHEVEVGVLRKEHKDKGQGRVLRRWLEKNVIPAFANRILPVDEAVVRCAAKEQEPDPVPFRDGLIGATAAVHDLTVVTRNVKDFSSVRTVNPWNHGEPNG